MSKRNRPDVTTVTLPEAARERLADLAAAWGLSRSEVVRVLVERADLAAVPPTGPTLVHLAEGLRDLRELVLVHEARLAALERES